MRRRAFTLVELLVVIAIIGILIALLMPAVNGARESGRQTTCRNNLRNLAMAARHYAERKSTFPPGGITEGPCCGTKSRTNWAIAILPFMDQQNLYDRYDQNAFNEDPVNAYVREAYVPTHVCPTEPDTGRTDIPESGPGGTWGVSNEYQRGSYRGVSGRSDGSAWWDGQQAHNGGSNFPLPSDWRGVFYTVGFINYGSVPPGAIRDGNSTTLLIGEMSSLTHQSRRTFWAYTYTSYNKSTVTPQTRTLLTDYDKCVAIGGPGGSNPCKRGWGSFHPNGLNYVMVDGSVHFFSSRLDMNLLAELATIASGDRVQLP